MNIELLKPGQIWEERRNSDGTNNPLLYTLKREEDEPRYPYAQMWTVFVMRGTVSLQFGQTHIVRLTSAAEWYLVA